MRHSSIASLALLLPALAVAQTPAQHILRGTVRAIGGAPLSGANVFLLESLEGALTDSAGRFTMRTAVRGEVTVVARHVGYAPATVIVPVDTNGLISFILAKQAVALSPITVRAGAYSAGNERGVTLSALEIVTIPGATANTARAIQSFPGVQTVDEGTALFVHGGDAMETKVLMNSLVLLAPYNYDAPVGNFAPSPNPFLLEGTFFSSGGFGARYGNVLSGVVDLRTAGRPAQSTVTASANLAGAATSASFVLSPTLGVHMMAGRTDLDWMFKLNSAAHTYDPAPKGTDVSGSVIYNYRPTAELKVFAIDQRSKVGIGATDPAGGYANHSRNTMIQAGWKDVFGALAPMLSASYTSVSDDNLAGVFDLGNDERWWQLFSQTEWPANDRVTMRAGGDLDWRDARFTGSIPNFDPRATPGTRVTLFDSRADGGRNGVFTEADWRASEHVQVTTGVRTDYTSFTHERTVDPRLSMTYQVGDASVSASTGDYHQVADPLYYADGIGHPGLRPMSARQYVLDGRLGDGKRMARLEIYDKRYHDLVGLARNTESKAVVGGGIGEARGLDAFIRRPLWPFASGRLTYSYVDSRRTDPNTGVEARTPFDITHSSTAVVVQDLPKGFSFATAFRYASGKPFTPVVGATRDATRATWTPVFGSPYSDLMPAYAKLDILISRVTRLSAERVLVWYVELGNALGRDNLYTYTYNADYTTRIPVRGLFTRSIFFGGSFTHLSN